MSPREDVRSWIRFARLSRKSGRLALTNTVSAQLPPLRFTFCKGGAPDKDDVDVPVHYVGVGEGIDDTVGTRSLRVAPAGENGLVEAVFVSADSSSRPLQLLTRWYGFAYTYPGCEIYGE